MWVHRDAWESFSTGLLKDQVFNLQISPKNITKGGCEELEWDSGFRSYLK